MRLSSISSMEDSVVVVEGNLEGLPLGKTRKVPNFHSKTPYSF